MRPGFAMSMAVPLLTTLFLPFAQTSSYAIERIINFETGNTSQVNGVFNAERTSIVPSTLPGGGNHAFRCMLPQGASETYCGVGIELGNMPEVHSDLYVRYYVKFEPSWRFATANPYFKSQVVEVNAADYTAGGRSFLNFNSISESTANIVFETYSDNNSWLQTGTTISNNGQWHCIETRHLRNLANPSQGRFQYWFDGQLMVNLFPINMGNAPPRSLTFGYRNGVAQQDMYMQYDDIVIADHYIGPIGSVSDRTAPLPPQNLSVR